MLQLLASELLNQWIFRVQNDELGWVFSPGSLKRGTKGYFKSWHQTFAWRHA